MKNGKKETILEQLAYKIGILEEQKNEGNYAGRPSTAKGAEPTKGQTPLP